MGVVLATSAGLLAGRGRGAVLAGLRVDERRGDGLRQRRGLELLLLDDAEGVRLAQRGLPWGQGVGAEAEGGWVEGGIVGGDDYAPPGRLLLKHRAAAGRPRRRDARG